jgi:undecaprenyl-diphosphatase
MDLHVDPPLTLSRLTARHRWVLPLALLIFLSLGVGAVFNTLPWDEVITNWIVNDLRSPTLDSIVKRVSFLGSTPVVLSVAAVAAALAWRRCPRLALAIVVIALCRPLAEFALKELVARDRPAGNRMVNGTGYSFPSGHPLATAASWGLLPLVLSLYTRRRALWWALTISVWTLAVLVAASRVWLGVHWASDVVAALALAVLGVAGSERLIRATHGTRRPKGKRCCEGTEAASPAVEGQDVDADVVDRPVLETAS